MQLLIMKHRILVRATLVALAAASVAACSSTHHSATTTTTAQHQAAAVESTSTTAEPTTVPKAPDACTLLTKQEAEAVTGIGLQDGVPGGPNGTVTSCEYTSPPTGETAQVTVTVGDGAKKIYDIDHDALKHDFTAIAGVGDEAWEENDGVFVRKGQTWVALTLVRLNDPSANRGPLETAIKLIASRLP